LTDYTLGNPDTLTKYKVAAEISQKVLKEVSGTMLFKLALTSRA
jgi:methionine aminopeptidase